MMHTKLLIASYRNKIGNVNS